MLFYFPLLQTLHPTLSLLKTKENSLKQRTSLYHNIDILLLVLLLLLLLLLLMMMLL